MCDQIYRVCWKTECIELAQKDNNEKKLTEKRVCGSKSGGKAASTASNSYFNFIWTHLNSQAGGQAEREFMRHIHNKFMINDILCEYAVYWK